MATIKTYTTDKIDTLLGNKADSSHTHTISQVTNLQSNLNAKQEKLVSGTNIKTVNNTSILGSGNLNIDGDAINLGTVTETGSALVSKLYDLLETNGKAIVSFGIEGWFYPDLADGPMAGNYVAFLLGESEVHILGNGKLYSVSSVGFTEMSYDKFDIDALLSNKQDTLKSGTNIKTINSQSLVGKGNINLNDTYYTKSEEDTKHSALTTKINEAQTKANDAYKLASGRNSGYTFKDKAAMTADLKAASNTKYKVGDVLFLEATKVPDYWITKILSTNTGTYGYYEIQEFETNVDLTPYQTIKIGPIKTYEASSVEGMFYEIANKTVDLDNHAGLNYRLGKVENDLGGYQKKDLTNVSLPGITTKTVEGALTTISSKIYSGTNSITYQIDQLQKADTELTNKINTKQNKITVDTTAGTITFTY